MLKKILNIFNDKNRIKTKKIDENSKVETNLNEDSINEESKINTNYESVEKQIILTDVEIELYISKEVNKRIGTENKSLALDIDLSDRDMLFEDAARLIVLNQQGSASLLQRKLKLGYNRAGRLMDQLEVAGIVGPFQGSNARKVLISDEIELEYLFKSEFYFNTKLLSSYEDEINSRINKYYSELKIKEENNLKEQIKFEILEKKRKEELRKEVLQELQEEGFIFNDYFDNNKRESISQETQDRVWNRDGGRCVKCGNNEKLEFDHIIPFSKGGSNTYRNLQLLCEKCNRTKSNKIG
ncbi:HNH endonuclease [Chishuiella changwenlii]|uniref:HNH endonuclease n=1 Tax=Chishuiella changwenlii TaxID=1434701 RepID=A0A1M6ZXY1_9FLAO|nr:hypothetical protein GCM10010984_07340 [Chishuiella changwenlii]SHL35341.1 HNH endonuclease [Chishuiella changwenlii]